MFDIAAATTEAASSRLDRLEHFRPAEILTPPAAGTPVDIDSLTESQRNMLRRAAFMYGNAPESYDLAVSPGHVLATPCGRGVLRVLPDRRCWHIPGGLIAPDELKPEFVHWLKHTADEQRKVVAVYGVTSEDVPVFEDAGYVLNKLGEEAVLDLGGIRWNGKPFEWIRRQTNFCKRNGLTIREVTSPQEQAELSGELMEILEDDLRRRVYSRPLRLLVGEFRPTNLQRRRLFLAEEQATGKVHAFLACSPMRDGNAWAFETYRKRRDSIRGTTAFLFRKVIDQMQAEGCRRISLCLVPGRGVDRDRSPNPDRGVRWILSFWYRRLNFLFNTRGQDHFKSRFRPRYEDRYVCVSPRSSLRSIASFLRISRAIRPNFANLARSAWSGLFRGGE